MEVYICDLTLNISSLKALRDSLMCYQFGLIMGFVDNKIQY